MDEELKRYKGELRIYQDAISIELFYPRNNKVKKIRVALSDIRAADDILIEYDFGRDGWIIKQASIFRWDADDKICDPDWQEVAFIQAWNRETKKEA